MRLCLRYGAKSVPEERVMPTRFGRVHAVIDIGSPFSECRANVDLHYQSNIAIVNIAFTESPVAALRRVR